jgi:error-prone DNA polymerase
MAGARSPDELCLAAERSGYKAIALCDAASLYGLPALVDAAAERGLKALAGASFRLPDGRALYVWALDRAGYGRLCRLTSAARGGDPAKAAEGEPLVGGIRGGDAGPPASRFPPPPGWAAVRAFDVLAALEGLGLGGLAVAAASEPALRRLAALPGAAGGEGAAGPRARANGGGGAVVGSGSRPGGLYVALESFAPMARAARLAARLGLRPLAVVAGRVLDPACDHERLRLLAAVERRVTVSAVEAAVRAGGAGADGLPEPDEPPLPGAARAAALYSAYPEAVTAAQALAAAAAPAASFFSSPPAFPRWRGLPEEEAYRALKAACEEGAARRYGPAWRGRADLAARLAKELRIIAAKGFSSYFLVVRDIVALCPRTCGRGSAASSVVSYLLFLTHVDPLAQELFFERFLNEGRTDPPDIDIDFPWDERPGVLVRVFEAYRGSAAMVADHCRFSGASRVREAALALGMSLDDVDEAVTRWRRGDEEGLPEALRRTAGLLKGLPRYLGTHPGGVVVVPGPMHDYAPTQPGLAGHPVLAWEKDGTERAGLVKIDLLGNRSLAVLRDCIELCSREERPEPGSDSWERFNPVDEPAARALIESGATVGVFYIESPATRQLLAKMRTADYGHLVAASSIIRPAANRYINEYVRRLRGEPWRRLPEAVEECLKETYGIMVYQEDVSRVAMAAAGFSAPEADGLRKTLSKKRGAAKLAAYRERLVAGCAERGMGEADAQELWDMMLSFDGYSFCKAHSASYALVSYRLAWMKARRPGYFIASVINNGGGFYGTQAYLDEARRLGFLPLPPRVNRSGSGYLLEPPELDEPSRRPNREPPPAIQAADPPPAAAGDTLPPGAPGSGARLRAGLRQIRGLSERCIQALLAERERGGPYRSVADLMARLKPAYLDYRALARSGAMDGLALTEAPGEVAGEVAGGGGAARPAMLWAYHAWKGGAACPEADFFGGQGLGVGFAWGGPGSDAPGRRGASDYGRARRLADEAECLGVILSAPPAELFYERALAAARRLGWPAPEPSDRLAELAELAGRGARVAMYGVAVAGKEVVCLDGRPMCFRSFQDRRGLFEAVLFPQVFKRLRPILEYEGAYLLLGVARNELGALALHVHDAASLNRGRSATGR